MSITTQLTRIIEARDKIREKTFSLGLVTEDAKIDVCASAIENINNIGAINLTIDSEYSGVYDIPSGYTSGGTISVTVITHYYYKDLLLPKLPSDAIDAYPYCWIRNNSQTGYYDLIMGTTSFYYDASNSRLRRRGTDTDLWYRIQKSAASTATSWGSPQSHSYVGWSLSSDRTAYWSNHDVTQSESSSSIYLKGSDPIPEISGQELMSMLEEVL